ncbi:MAG: hypothetical protein NXH82_01495 [Rhodobacteraceae bacterium]|nr:hypothetical protein [Paracoccaceae bacterium]
MVTPTGNPLQLNTFQTSRKSDVDVLQLDPERSVAVWRSENQDGSGFGVFGQVFAHDGRPIGAEFRVNDETQDFQRDPDIAQILQNTATAPSAASLIVFEGPAPGRADNILARVFDRDLQPVGTDILISGQSNFGGFNPSVAVLADGNLAVAWQSLSRDGDSWGDLRATAGPERATAAA